MGTVRWDNTGTATNGLESTSGTAKHEDIVCGIGDILQVGIKIGIVHILIELNSDSGDPKCIGDDFILTDVVFASIRNKIDRTNERTIPYD